MIQINRTRLIEWFDALTIRNRINTHKGYGYAQVGQVHKTEYYEYAAFAIWNRSDGNEYYFVDIVVGDELIKNVTDQIDYVVDLKKKGYR